MPPYYASQQTTCDNPQESTVSLAIATVAILGSPGRALLRTLQSLDFAITMGRNLPKLPTLEVSASAGQTI